ncbi:D-alanyl-D-alanine carboxypeptidase/D-alanyl-D-alanine endopeptidase [Pseudothioclava arenosa]|uniref:D-alanyl-D-alanine carboxypeptidase/D-alanyl-D-alanine-endopeptidase n=1 Tax=Pseudothioclava arenosa TaxID=1795308 RepID=A0A2A4CQA2_9RHOB|nr:D-alanyl-D-alanine carboxypeptidase/D-alanyl-D-alanine-endopeptidase [Pseudothioclava arenosa]PCD77421.1 D-alanyl-D-alanine carboxypeptidase/D-alanyl-D-alanine-endopeptidase [Pseudothioclava arenosa]
MRISRRNVISGLGGMTVAPLAAVVPARAQQGASVRELLKAAALGGDIGYAVTDLRSGRVLEAFNAQKALPAASTTKAITSLYALEHLGGGYRFATRLIATGPVRGGVLQGDLVLAGGADPTLSTDDLGDMAAALVRGGVRGITGRFLVWAGAIPRSDEIAGDQPIHVGYNPAVAGIILNYNRVHFAWKRAGGGYQLAMEALGERYRPQAYTAAAKLVNRRAPVYSYRSEGGKEVWSVAAGALGKAGSRWLPVRDPAAYAGDVFQTLARAQGLALPAPREVRDLPAGEVLYFRQSEALPGLLRAMMKYSTNITAEAVGMTTSVRRGADARMGRSGVAMSAWLEARVGVKSARFVDHSGLNTGSRISAGDMAQAMGALGAPMGLRGLMKPFDMRDGEGRKVKGHPLRVDAKTGTLDYVSTLAGYMTAPSGRELGFAIFTGDLARRAREKAADGEGGASKGWIRRSKVLQSRLLERWGALYG